jgi:lysophospholipase L1-like esterase
MYFKKIRIKKFISRGLLVLGAILLAAVSGEAYFRAFNPQPVLSRVQDFSFNCFQEGEHRWLKLSPNKNCLLQSTFNSFSPVVVKTNSLGLRNPEIDKRKMPETKRILFIGDSFTMGWGVKEEEAYPRVTEKLMQKMNLPYRIETINAGFTAAGPSGYYLYLKLYSQELQPDIMVIGFYLGNDIISRRDVAWVKVDKDGLPEVIRSRSTYIDQNGHIRRKDLPLRYRIPYLQESHLFIFLANTIFKKVAPVNSADEITSLIPCLFDKKCRNLDKEKSEVKRLFQAMKEITDKQGIKLVVVLIPTDFQVNADARLKYMFDLPFLPSERRYPNEEFSQFFRENKIDYVDLYETFTNYDTKNTYFDRDDHWNAFGHQLAAEVISVKLKDILQLSLQ